MRWIDKPNLADDTGKAIYAALASAIYIDADLRAVWTSIGESPGDQNWAQKASHLWPAMLADAHAVGKLNDLLTAARAHIPALGDKLDPLLTSTIVTAEWYVPRDVFNSRLLGSRHAICLLDRSSLSNGLRRIADGDPVFTIAGDPGTGKSWSRHLIQHVVKHESVGCKMVPLIVEDQWPNEAVVNARKFTRTLGIKAGFDDPFDIDENTEDTHKARELADKFVMHFAKLEERGRWIFIDGLDRACVAPGVQMVVTNLAAAVERDELGETRLIATGFEGDFPGDVERVLVEEQIDRIGESHLTAFFTEVAADMGREANAERDELVQELVTEVLAEASLGDLAWLGEVASRVAYNSFGAP